MASGKISRRSFLGYATAAMGAFVASLVAVPLVGSFISPATQKMLARQWIKLGPLSKFPQGEPRMVGFTLVKQDGWVETRQPRLVWVVKLGDNDYWVCNAQCTHLGCIVDWHTEDGTFKSPCHGGVFAKEDGRVLAGPPPRPLDSLEYKIESGELWVNYQDFRLGISGKVPIA